MSCDPTGEERHFCMCICECVNEATCRHGFCRPCCDFNPETDDTESGNRV